MDDTETGARRSNLPVVPRLRLPRDPGASSSSSTSRERSRSPIVSRSDASPTNLALECVSAETQRPLPHGTIPSIDASIMDPFVPIGREVVLPPIDILSDYGGPAHRALHQTRCHIPRHVKCDLMDVADKACRVEPAENASRALIHIIEVYSKSVGEIDEDVRKGLFQLDTHKELAAKLLEKLRKVRPTHWNCVGMREAYETVCDTHGRCSQLKHEPTDALSECCDFMRQRQEWLVYVPPDAPAPQSPRSGSDAGSRGQSSKPLPVPSFALIGNGDNTDAPAFPNIQYPNPEDAPAAARPKPSHARSFPTIQYPDAEGVPATARPRLSHAPVFPTKHYPDRDDADSTRSVISGQSGFPSAQLPHPDTAGASTLPTNALGQMAPFPAVQYQNADDNSSTALCNARPSVRYQHRDPQPATALSNPSEPQVQVSSHNFSNMQKPGSAGHSVSVHSCSGTLAELSTSGGALTSISSLSSRPSVHTPSVQYPNPIGNPTSAPLNSGPIVHGHDPGLPFSTGNVCSIATATSSHLDSHASPSIQYQNPHINVNPAHVLPNSEARRPIPRLGVGVGSVVTASSSSNGVPLSSPQCGSATATSPHLHSHASPSIQSINPTTALPNSEALTPIPPLGVGSVVTPSSNGVAFATGNGTCNSSDTSTSSHLNSHGSPRVQYQDDPHINHAHALANSDTLSPIPRLGFGVGDSVVTPSSNGVSQSSPHSFPRITYPSDDDDDGDHDMGVEATTGSSESRSRSRSRSHSRWPHESQAMQSISFPL